MKRCSRGRTSHLAPITEFSRTLDKRRINIRADHSSKHTNIYTLPQSGLVKLSPQVTLLDLRIQPIMIIMHQPNPREREKRNVKQITVISALSMKIIAKARSRDVSIKAGRTVRRFRRERHFPLIVYRI